MPHGLGLSRETNTAGAAENALVARAQGSLVPNQTRPTATTPVGVGQQAGQPATARPKRGFGSPGIPSLEEDPLGAIFFALREVGAALQGKKLPSETAREGADAQEELELRQQGLRLKGIGLGMRALKSGLEILDTIPNDQADAAIEQLTKSVQIPGFDMGAILKAHKDGEIEGFRARLDQIRDDPTLAAYLANIPDIETSSPKALNSAMEKVIKLRDELVGAVAKQKALAPGVEAAKKTTAERNTEFLAGLPAGKKRDIAEKLLLDEKGTDSFFRALDELSKLAVEGKTPDNDSRAKAVQKRVDSLIDKSGFSITFDDKGRVTGITQGAQPFSDLSAQDKQKALAGIDTVNKTIDLLDGVIGKIDEDPTLFGIVGTGRRIGQTLVGVASDLGGIIEKATGVDINKGADRIAKALSGTPLEAEFEGIFNPTLSKLQLLENTLAFDLARLRLTSGGGNIRALKQAFIDAKDDVKLTGATSSKDVRARMVEVKSQFVRELRNISKRLTGKEAERKETPESKDDDLKRKVDKILGIGK